MKHVSSIIILSLFYLTAFSQTETRQVVPTGENIQAIILKVNNYWQGSNPESGNAFWDNAAYHTGNMAAYFATGNEAYRKYSEKWAQTNEWKGAKSNKKTSWKYTYGETDEYVLFGDWQICFQTYIDLYNLSPDEKKIARALEVMEYEMSTTNNDYWWWADGFYMVMPVMTKLYKVTGNELYLSKLYDYFSYAKQLMYDAEAGLFYRDAKYIYPKHKTNNDSKDFWSRGNGWVFAGLAKVLQDLPIADAHRSEYVQVYQQMAEALKNSQQEQGYWTRSLLDEQQAPGYETSGTAFFTYGFLWGINNGILEKTLYTATVNKSWNYLSTIALQADGKIGYVQPIGERADQHKNVNAETTANFGVGAFLLAASEMTRYVNAEMEAWAGNAVNTVIFRNNSIVTYKNTQFMAWYNPKGYVCLGKRTVGSQQWEIKQTNLTGSLSDAHNCISIMVDGEGYLHISWNHHGSQLNYTKSVSPLSLDLEENQQMTGNHEEKVTYPGFYTMADGKLFFLYRDGYSGKGNLLLNSYNDATKTWTQIHENLIDGEGARSAYWQACTDRNNVIHISWVWRETPDVATNHDMCYARSADGGKTWTDSKGKIYQLPITAQTAELAATIPPNSELINQTSMTADENGKPYIATYYRNQDSAIPQYHIIYLNEDNEWKTVSSDFRKTPFTLSGVGTKKIAISRPQILCHGKTLFLIYRDQERDSRVSMAICNNLQENQWKIKDLTDYSVGDWEPTYDTELWKKQYKLNLFIQKTGQGDGEQNTDLPPQPVSVLDVSENFLITEF
jgi:rhamnogalacturonyl hydrolase YesR